MYNWSQDTLLSPWPDYVLGLISGFSSVNSMKREHSSQSVFKKEKIGWGSFPECQEVFTLETCTVYH